MWMRTVDNRLKVSTTSFAGGTAFGFNKEVKFDLYRNKKEKERHIGKKVRSYRGNTYRGNLQTDYER